MARFMALRPMQAQLVAAISRYGQLGLAAEICGLAQPAASRMLRELETHYEAALFVRTPKGMEPTAEGALLAAYAAELVSAQTRLSQALGTFKAGQSGRVRIGAVTGPAIGIVVPAITQMKRTSPEVDLTLEVAPSTQLVEALQRNELDFVLARLPESVDDRGFAIWPGREEAVDLLVRHDHPLLAEKPLNLAALHDRLWVMQQHGTPIRRAVENAFHENGLTSPANVVSASSILVIIALLRDSDAIAALSREVAEMMIDHPVSAAFRRLPLDTPIHVAPYQILRWRDQHLGPAAEALFTAIRARLAPGA
ncbi:LysR family transcriptional regulator [Thioclava sp. GXIMD2076]|uniref:LysR family transcriptional regulator n=1 Tax=Thioclava kandeliae TaxID=3070818 RepID=A0ABV1SEP9_9RHOB